jgi:dihydroorotate dehydrogenase
MGLLRRSKRVVLDRIDINPLFWCFFTSQFLTRWPPPDSGKTMLYRLARPLLFRINPETAHRATIFALRAMPSGKFSFDSRLASRVAGIDFPSPVGLAAGFDKNAEVPDAMLGLGFGFVEVGTITPQPQIGNPKPRLFRLVEDEGVINRMGFNNGGHAATLARLATRERRGIVGINIGANKDAADRVTDYVAGMQAMAAHADYITVNISSPNTPGLRGLQDKAALDELLDAVMALRTVPVFLKVAPDLDAQAIDDISAVTIARGVDALIVGNTTLARPAMQSPWQGEVGGLSGTPLRALAMEKLKVFRCATGGAVPLIAAGGIDSAHEAYARIRAGASLVQIYSALVYHGPGLAKSIAVGLAHLLERDGFAKIADAVGVDAI